MKKLSLLFLTLLNSSNALSAQNPLGISEDSLNNLNQSMQQFQSCMKGIDRAAMTSIQNQAQQFKMDIDALCRNGKRSEAQHKAVATNKKLVSHPALQRLKQCGSIMSVPGSPSGFSMTIKPDIDFSTHHVCDLP